MNISRGAAMTPVAAVFRNPGLVLTEKALRLAHRHYRQSDRPRLQGFFLGSVLVDAGERSPLCHGSSWS